MLLTWLGTQAPLVSGAAVLLHSDPGEYLIWVFLQSKDGLHYSGSQDNVLLVYGDRIHAMAICSG